ncbi:FtsL-like putative cell division protein [Rurimicrobium arvi]|uniref:Cell division protein FtsL n=1 Tax=Rurimicrobium arvi TaxID=2049916 RepID=A0ABP8MGQ7_9BACT
MSQEEIIQEETASSGTQKVVAAKLDWRSVVDRISYNGIVKNVPYLAFIVLLGVFYIANSHLATEMQRERDAQQKALKELRWRNMDVQSKLMNAGMEAEVIRRGAGLGMKPLMIPAYKVVIDSVKGVVKK